MHIGVPAESAALERRTALTPDVAGRLINAGHTVTIESGAGLPAGHRDEEYEAKGAAIGSRAAAFAADLIAVVRRPENLSDLSSTRSLVGLLQPLDEPRSIADLATTGVAAFAFELVPRTTRAQTVDALSSQATAAGYQAVLEAAARCDRFFPMLTTAAGTIRPSKVLVLGAGVAGLQAIATARRLGAVVSAFDVRAAAAEQVKSLGATFVEVGEEPQDASTSGGYARELEVDQQRRILDGLAEHVAGADAVIATAAIPGRPAPLLIEAGTVERMRPGSVIVDLAATTGGNCELTEAGKDIDHRGVTIIGATDLVSRVAGHASQMYARNVAAFIDLIAPDGELALDVDDDIVRDSCVTRDGEVVNPAVRNLLEGA